MNGVYGITSSCLMLFICSVISCLCLLGWNAIRSDQGNCNSPLHWLCFSLRVTCRDQTAPQIHQLHTLPKGIPQKKKKKKKWPLKNSTHLRRQPCTIWEGGAPEKSRKETQKVILSNLDLDYSHWKSESLCFCSYLLFYLYIIIWVSPKSFLAIAADFLIENLAMIWKWIKNDLKIPKKKTNKEDKNQIKEKDKTCVLFFVFNY